MTTKSLQFRFNGNNFTKSRLCAASCQQENVSLADFHRLVVFQQKQNGSRAHVSTAVKFQMPSAVQL